MEEILGEHVTHFVIICVGEKFTTAVESCRSLIPAKTETESKQPIGEAAVNDINSVFYHDVRFIFLGYHACFEETKPRLHGKNNKR